MRSRRSSSGFTLLEVMMATAVLAVGTISVLMVFGTALSFAHRRQGQQQLAQVLEEARSHGRSLVNRYQAPKAAAAGAAAKSGTKDKPPAATAGSAKDRKAFVSTVSTPAGPATTDTEPKSSTVFAAYRYRLHFEPVRADAVEAGWKTTVVIEWGDGQSYQETLALRPDVIPDEEFASSISFAAERTGDDKGSKGTRESR